MKSTLEKFPLSKSVIRISRIPVVETGYNFASDVYNKIKKSNGLITWSFNSAEASVMLAVEITLPAVLLFETPLHTVDNLICRSIEIVEERIPAIKYPPKEMYYKTKDYVSTKVVLPVLKRADSVKQISLQNASKYSEMAATKLDNALDIADKYVDKYLPDVGDNPSDTTENCITTGKIPNNSKPVETERQQLINNSSKLDSRKILCFMDKRKEMRTRETKFKIHIFADDHGRGLAVILKKYFPIKSQIHSFVKPRAWLSGVISGCIPNQYSKFDFIIIIGGTNDIILNRGKGIFGNLELALISLSKTNVWLCTLPYRFDLDENSIDHENIKIVNNYIKELSSRLDYVKLIDLYKMERHHFTIDGFCMNMRGKIRFATAIYNLIKAECCEEADSLFPVRVEAKSFVTSANPIRRPDKGNFLELVIPVSTPTSPSKGWNLCSCMSRLFWQMFDSTRSSSPLKDSSVAVHGGSKTAQTIRHVNVFSKKLQRRLTRRTIAEARALKQQSADTLQCLIYLADLLARDPKAFMEKVRTMWAHLSEDEPENQVPPANLEQLIAMLTREVARRVVHLVNYTGTTIKNVPHRVNHTIHVAVHNINSVADYVLKKIHLDSLKIAVVAQAKLQYGRARDVVTQIQVLGINLLERIISQMTSATHHIHASSPLKPLPAPGKTAAIAGSSTSSPKNVQSPQSSNNEQGSPKGSKNSSLKEQSQDKNNSSTQKKKGQEKEKEKSPQSKEEHTAEDTVN